MRRWPPVILACALLATGLSTLSTLSSTSSAFSGSTGNPTTTFAAAANFCRSYTPVWMTGMEHGAASNAGLGLFDALATGGGTPTADATVSRSGNYALKVAKSNAGTSYARRALANPGVVVARFALRLGSLPGADVSELFSISVPAGGNVRLGWTSATGKLSAGFIGGTAQPSASTVAAGRWYLIELRATVSTDPRTLDWRVDQVDQPQASRSTAGSAASNVYLASNVAGDAFTAWYDDILVTTTSADHPLGDSRILPLTPDAVTAVSDGSGHLDFDTGTAVTNGGTLWNRLDESPMTSTTDFMKQVGNDAAAYAQLSFADTARTNVCVNSVSGVLAYHSSNATGASGKTAIWESGTERVVYNSTMNPGATITYKSLVVTPASGSWTAAKLNGLVGRIGYSPTATAANYAAWDALTLEYETTPNPPSAYQNTVSVDAPAGYWRLGETSGTTTAAALGTPDGTYTNSPTLGVSSLIGDTDMPPSSTAPTTTSPSATSTTSSAPPRSRRDLGQPGRGGHRRVPVPGRQVQR
jgi:hypothetical protein